MILFYWKSILILYRNVWICFFVHHLCHLHFFRRNIFIQMQISNSYEFRNNLLFLFMYFCKIKYTSLRTCHNIKFSCFKIHWINLNSNWLISNNIFLRRISRLNRHKRLFINLFSKRNLIAKIVGCLKWLANHPKHTGINCP